MKPKHQRLALLVLALVAVGGALALALSSLGDRATYFYSPSDVAEKGVEPGRAIRLGGMVVTGSLTRHAGGEIRFAVTDNRAISNVSYTGIPPDLFKEASGVVAEGRFTPDGLFVADNLLAKHDENYMPPEVAGAMHEAKTLEQ